MREGKEQKMVITLGEHFKILRTNVTNDAVEIIYEFETKYFNDFFPIVDVEDLSLEDEFLKNYQPETERQRRFKIRLEDAIKSGVKNFRKPIVDPSFNRKGKIVYETGRMPAVDRSADWWYGTAKDFIPSKNSRLGTTKEYDAFLGFLIKKLIKVYGYSVKEAWYAICDDSKKLGHYTNSSRAKKQFEETGSRTVLGFSDLANTGKIIIEVVEDGIRYSTASGNYNAKSTEYPIEDKNRILRTHRPRPYSVGWIILNV